ncbi:MAG TPA: DUF421 domain-containing protein [Syntrophomonadaceae bacterium]|nr:DUF421 domain-containing protein [Syntrophomonadaceae bacterium]
MPPIYLKVALQTILAFFAVLIVTRILEKEQLSHLTYYEYVTGITLGSLAAGLAIDAVIPAGAVLLALVIFSALTYLMGYISLKNRVARKLLEGEPTIVVQNGKIMEKNMGRLRYNVDDLLVQLREKGYFNISDVEFAILEPHGKLSVLPKSSKKPVTREDLQIPSSYEGVGSELIIDGEIIYQNLKQNNLDEAWLINQLEKQGIHSPKDVMFAGLDTQGNLYIDRKQDGLTHDVQVSDDPDLNEQIK